MDPQCVAEGLGFPEGPVAMNDGSLLFVDIKKQQLSRLGVDGKVERVVSLPGGPNGLAIGPDGAAYVCNNGGVYDFVEETFGGKTITLPKPKSFKRKRTAGSIQRVDLVTKKVTTLFYRCDGRPLIAPDDIIFDAKRGGFWFTDSGMQDNHTLRKGGLYYATIDAKEARHVATIPTANGVGLSPDGDTLYVSDTIFGRLWSLKIISAGVVQSGLTPAELKSMPTGSLPPLPPTAPGQVVQTLPGFQWLDSLKVEQDGRICVGTLMNFGITIFSLDGTTELVRVNDIMTTNLCFGGPDMQDVWITASSTGTIYKTRWPRPGLKPAYTA